MRPLPVYHIFPQYFINGTIFKLLSMNCVLTPSTATFGRKVPHSNKNSARQYHKCTEGFKYSTRHFYHTLIKPKFPRQILEKYSNSKLHQISSCGSRGFPCGRKDRQTRQKWRSFHIYQHAKGPTKCWNFEGQYLRGRQGVRDLYPVSTITWYTLYILHIMHATLRVFPIPFWRKSTLFSHLLTSRAVHRV
jgi:hypothetical protein